MQLATWWKAIEPVDCACMHAVKLGMGDPQGALPLYEALYMYAVVKFLVYGSHYLIFATQ